MSELEAMRKRCDTLQEQLNTARKDNDELKLQIAYLEEDLEEAQWQLDREGNAPSLPIRHYVPLPIWDAPQWRSI